MNKGNKLQLRNMLLLKSCSAVDLFCNMNVVTKICTSKNSMTVKGNEGDLKTYKKAYVKNYGEVWFDERAITNIMSLNNVKEKFRVTYDSDRYGKFTVHKPNGVNIKFGMHYDGLHYHDTVNRQVTIVQTVTENEKGYSQRQLTDAKTARDLYAKVGYPLIKDFVNMVKENMIMNCPVTIEDIIRSKKSNGPSVQALKGKNPAQNRARK